MVLTHLHNSASSPATLMLLSFSQMLLCPLHWSVRLACIYFHSAEEERRKGYKKKNFKQAKLDFVDQMLDWSGARSPASVLDVGCGIGGTTRILARKFPDAQVKGKIPFGVRSCSNVVTACHTCSAVEA